MASFLPLRPRFFLDVVCIISVGVSLLIYEKYAVPFNNGFYCSDTSLRYPFYDSTISSGSLALVALLVPVLIVLAIEAFCLFESSTPRDSWQTIGLKLIYSCYHFCGMFIFGAGLCQLTVTIAKYSIGRLRPHFFDVCRPNVNCTEAILYKYITDYKCTGTEYSEHILLDARLSFPSGHASLAFYAATFTVLYLQRRVAWKQSTVVLHFVQALILFGAWFTALSRIQNNMHHWGDVLVGTIIGAFWALFFVKYVVNMELPVGDDAEMSNLRQNRDSNGMSV